MTGNHSTAQCTRVAKSEAQADEQRHERKKTYMKMIEQLVILPGTFGQVVCVSQITVLTNWTVRCKTIPSEKQQSDQCCKGLFSKRWNAHTHTQQMSPPPFPSSLAVLGLPFASSLAIPSVPLPLPLTILLRPETKQRFMQASRRPWMQAQAAQSISQRKRPTPRTCQKQFQIGPKIRQRNV